MNYQRWQRSFHLATITHIPQPPSKGSRPPPRFREGAAWGPAEDGKGGGVSGCTGGQTSLCYTFVRGDSAARTCCVPRCSVFAGEKLFVLSIHLFFPRVCQLIANVRNVKCQQLKCQPVNSTPISTTSPFLLRILVHWIFLIMHSTMIKIAGLHFVNCKY